MTATVVDLEAPRSERGRRSGHSARVNSIVRLLNHRPHRRSALIKAVATHGGYQRPAVAAAVDALLMVGLIAPTGDGHLCVLHVGRDQLRQLQREAVALIRTELAKAGAA